MPHTIDAYASLSATLPGIDCQGPSKHKGRRSLRRFKRPVEQRRSARLIADDFKPPDLHAGKNGPCPGCPNFDRCTALVICCESFALFTRVGNDYNAERWKWAPRQPSAAIMERLVGSARQSKLERRREREALAVRMEREAAEF
jgi:hypothetical protein